ncbi:hypothetical protein LSCM4_02046 [Leishmania orientalis]|uniref:JmjC domain-containing protein n=1 Tax=Leishmania orientalis TaxID=2249476 RepID=A0A836H9S4_9TRYP|nr:hypothetical protein LSCM4_02046 [Leishmania orientalis]
MSSSSATSPVSSSSPSLGPLFRAITPRLWARYLQQYLDVPELLTLSETCWTFFVRCNEEPLWRELCLRPPYIDAHRKIGLFTFRGSWKHTVCAFHGERAGGDRQGSRSSTAVLAQSRSIAEASLCFNVLLPRLVSCLQASGELDHGDCAAWLNQLRSQCAAGADVASGEAAAADDGRDEDAVEAAVEAEMSVQAWQETVLGKLYAPTLAKKYLSLSAGAINYFLRDGTFLRPPREALRQSRYRLALPHTEFADNNWYGTSLLALVPLPQWCTNARFFATFRWKTSCSTCRFQCCDDANALLDDAGGVRDLSRLPDELRGVPGAVDRRYQLSVEAFQLEYEAPNKPVVLTGCIEDWPAREAWRDIHFFRRFASEALKANGRTADGRRFRMSAADYLAYVVATNAEKPMYVFDKKVLARCTALLADYTIPPYFTEDFFSHMAGEDRPDYRWLLVGPDGSGSPFHTDPHGTSAWNAVLSGCKRVTFYPPHVVPPGVEEEWIHSDYYASEPCLRWYRMRGDSLPNGSAVRGTFSKEHVGEAYHGAASELQPVEALVFPGDLVFIPSGWWHQVLNIGHTVAVTQNVCSRITFPRVVADMNAHADRRVRKKFQCALRRAGRDDLAVQLHVPGT